MEYKELITLVIGYLAAIVAIGEAKVESDAAKVTAFVIAAGVFVGLGVLVR